MTDDEKAIKLAKKEEMIAACIEALPQRNWTLGPLSNSEKQLIGLAVSWTLEALAGKA